MVASFSHRRSRMVNKWHLGSGREEERYPRKLSSTSGVWGQGGRRRDIQENSLQQEGNGPIDWRAIRARTKEQLKLEYSRQSI